MTYGFDLQPAHAQISIEKNATSNPFAVQRRLKPGTESELPIVQQEPCAAAL